MREGTVLRVAVVDDDAKLGESLRLMIERDLVRREIAHEVCVFNAGLAFLDAKAHSFDLVFLDVEMPGLDGMEAARELRGLDGDVCIVFVTSFSRYALAGYEVGALDYIVKPPTADKLSRTIDRALVQVQRKNDRASVLIKHDGISTRVEVSEIGYVEAARSYVIFHTDRGTIRTRQTMRLVEEQLSSHGFSRCNQAYLVNLDRISRIAGDYVQVMGDELKISRQRRRSFLEAVAAHVGGTL